jgi:tetratricopeptide (TPR) repeat protein
VACRLHALSLLALLVASASRVSAEQAQPSPSVNAVSDPKLDEARRVVTSAERLFDAGHFQAALAEYGRAYDILQGHARQYFVLYNLAACNERLFRYDIAVELYEQYLIRAPETEQDRGQVVAIVRKLRTLLGSLSVESETPASIWVDDRRLGVTPGRWLLPAGPHVVEARAELHESQRQEVQLRAGEQLRLRFRPKRLSTYKGPGPRYFWATAALTGAAAIASATLGVMALSASKKGRDGAEYYLDTSAEARRTRNYALATDIGFGATALLGTGTTVLYFITDWGDAPQRTEPRPSGGIATLHVVF